MHPTQTTPTSRRPTVHSDWLEPLVPNDIFDVLVDNGMPDETAINVADRIYRAVYRTSPTVSVHDTLFDADAGQARSSES